MQKQNTQLCFNASDAINTLDVLKQRSPQHFLQNSKCSHLATAPVVLPSHTAKLAASIAAPTPPRNVTHNDARSSSAAQLLNYHSDIGRYNQLSCHSNIGPL
jgi:hypothetical protein